MKPVGLFLAALVSVSTTQIANAAVVDLLPTNTSLGIYLKTFPSGTASSKVYLDSGTSSELTGHVGSQSGVPVVNFDSPIDLKAANGFAHITRQSGTFQSLTVSVPGYSFGGIGFSTQIAELSKALDLTISAYSDGNLLGSLTFSKSSGLIGGSLNGDGAKKDSNQSWYLLAEGSAAITSIVLESTTGFKKIQQFLLSDLVTLPTEPDPVSGPEVSQNPLPAAAWLFGTIVAGGFGAGAWRRRRK